MAAGTILTIDVAVQVGHKFLEAVRSWLASRRTEIEVEAPGGIKVKISAANFDEAMSLLERAKGIQT